MWYATFVQDIDLHFLALDVPQFGLAAGEIIAWHDDTRLIMVASTPFDYEDWDALWDQLESQGVVFDSDVDDWDTTMSPDVDVWMITFTRPGERHE